MNLMPLLPLTAFTVNIFIWGYLFAQRRTDMVNILYHHIALFMAIWSLADFLLWAGFIPNDLVVITARIQSLFWIPLGGLLLGFVYEFVGRKRDLLLKTVCGLSIAFMLASLFTPWMIRGFHPTPWGISQEFGPLILPDILLLFFFPYGITLYLIISRVRASGNRARNRQLLLVMGGTLCSLLIGVTVNIVMGHVLGMEVVQFGSSVSIIMNIFILQAIIQYNFMAVDSGQLEVTFRHLFDNVADGIVITGHGGRILQLNDTARHILRLEGPRKDMPVFSQVVPEFGGSDALAGIGITRDDREGNRHSYILSRSAIPFADSTSCHLVMIRDLTDLKRSESHLQQSARQIRRQSKFNRIRAQIWRIAGEKELSEDQLIQKLLDTIGPELGVSRACFNRVTGDEVVCALEWRRPEAASTLGTTMSFSIVRYLLKKDLQTIDFEAAVRKIPSVVRPVARKILEAMVRQQDIDSISYIPYYIHNEVEGILSFDICRSQPVKPEWGEEQKNVVYDLVMIISQSIDNMRMERSIREARDGLETRVRERTAELEEVNIRLAGSLQEKEVLLKEVHHRVKNNLQTITSLLALQSRHVEDAKARELFRDLQSRVRSISIIHERLYQSPDLARVDFSQYVTRLANELRAMYNIGPGKAELDIRISGISLGVDTAIPCGLIISELAVNAFKYAFPGDRKGTLTIVLEAETDGRIRLELADDGVGLPENLDFDTDESFGLQLVKTLTDQLEGTIAVSRQSGTAYTILFRG